MVIDQFLCKSQGVEVQHRRVGKAGWTTSGTLDWLMHLNRSAFGIGGSGVR